MAPNITVLHLTLQHLQNDKRTNILNIYFAFLMKRDGVDRMFPFIKRDISEWD